MKKKSGDLSCFPYAKYPAVSTVVMDTTCQAHTDLDSPVFTGIDRLKLDITQQHVVLAASLAGQVPTELCVPFCVCSDQIIKAILCTLRPLAFIASFPLDRRERGNRPLAENRQVKQVHKPAE